MTACPLSLLPDAEPPVWPEVPPGADILNVGFAPGRDEVLAGRPFVGPSGKLLRQWLKQTGLLERSAFVNCEAHRTRDMVCVRCKVEYHMLGSKLVDLYLKMAEGRKLTKAQQTLYEKWAAAEHCEHLWKETRGNREPNPKTENCALPTIEKLLASGRF